MTINSNDLPILGLGNSSNVIPGPWQPGQLKERAGFLVSISLTLPAAPPRAAGVIRRYTSCPPKKKLGFSIMLHSIMSFREENVQLIKYSQYKPIP